MLSGINTDIEHDGKIYHVQTEDGGHQNPVIVTHLFAGGAILASRKVSYADVIQGGPNRRDPGDDEGAAPSDDQSLASDQRSGVGRTRPLNRRNSCSAASLAVDSARPPDARRRN
jgi:hypothetical protein